MTYRTQGQTSSKRLIVKLQKTRIHSDYKSSTLVYHSPAGGVSVFLGTRDQLWDARLSAALHFSRASHEHPAADPVDVWVVREAAPVARETNADHNRERLDDPKG